MAPAQFQKVAIVPYRLIRTNDHPPILHYRLEIGKISLSVPVDAQICQRFLRFVVINLRIAQITHQRRCALDQGHHGQ
jgi:hypothetical protein